MKPLEPYLFRCKKCGRTWSSRVPGRYWEFCDRCGRRTAPEKEERAE